VSHRALSRRPMRHLPRGGLAAPPARTAAASACTPMRPCSRNFGHGSRPQPVAPSYPSASRSNTPSATSATGKGGGLATSASVRTSSISVGPQWSITSISRCTCPPMPTTSPHEFWTAVLVDTLSANRYCVWMAHAVPHSSCACYTAVSASVLVLAPPSHDVGWWYHAQVMTSTPFSILSARYSLETG